MRFGHAPEPVESQRSRHAMILPLSGKWPEALRGLAEACVAWLGRGDIAKALNADAGALLADIVWTAGTIAATFPLAPPSPLAMATTWVPGLRSLWHLKKGLKYRKLPQRHPPAFIFISLPGQRSDLYEELYRTEPVLRVVMDLCDGPFPNERAE